MVLTDYPFTLFIVFVVACFAIAIFLHSYISKKYHYVCQKCNKTFKLTTTQSMGALNKYSRGKIRCPHCNDYNVPKREKDTTHT